nr:serine/threonine-protein kinase [Actinomadura rayongensis]
MGPGDPRRVDEYDLVARLGEGGMGTVYLGRTRTGRAVAVKSIRADFQGRDELRRRFAGEVRAAGRVSALYTAAVVKADPGADPPWLVTAYVPGPSLDEAVDRFGPLPPDSARVLGAHLAEGLAAVHRAGLVHRDLKPGNIVLAEDGPRIIDFGIALALDTPRHSVTGSVIGTLAYMAPEQVRGERDLDARTDVFALGGVLAHAATGRPPFGDLPQAAVIYRIMDAEPDLAGLPPVLHAVVAACLAKDRRDRPTLEEVIDRLMAPGPPPTSWLPPPVVGLIEERRRTTAAALTGPAAPPSAHAHGTPPVALPGAAPVPGTPPGALPGAAPGYGIPSAAPGAAPVPPGAAPFGTPPQGVPPAAPAPGVPSGHPHAAQNETPPPGPPGATPAPPYGMPHERSSGPQAGAPYGVPPASFPGAPHEQAGGPSGPPAGPPPDGSAGRPQAAPPYGVPPGPHHQTPPGSTPPAPPYGSAPDGLPAPPYGAPQAGRPAIFGHVDRLAARVRAAFVPQEGQPGVGPANTPPPGYQPPGAPPPLPWEEPAGAGGPAGGEGASDGDAASSGELNGGLAARARGETDRARRLLERAATSANRYVSARAMLTLGAMDEKLGALDTAGRWFSLAAASGHHEVAPKATLRLAQLAARRGDHALARRLYGDAARSGSATVVAEAEQALTELGAHPSPWPAPPPPAPRGPGWAASPSAPPSAGPETPPPPADQNGPQSATPSAGPPGATPSAGPDAVRRADLPPDADAERD